MHVRSARSSSLGPYRGPSSTSPSGLPILRENALASLVLSLGPPWPFAAAYLAHGESEDIESVEAPRGGQYRPESHIRDFTASWLAFCRRLQSCSRLTAAPPHAGDLRFASCGIEGVPHFSWHSKKRVVHLRQPAPRVVT
jgi:hypothetical protein